MNATVTGAIIAGGQSRRMGHDKRFITVDGTPMIMRVFERIRSVTSHQLVIANDGNILQPTLPDVVNIIPDDVANTGSLGGILTALNHSPTAWVLCVAADMPFINSDVMRRMIDFTNEPAQVILPMMDNRPQNLHALYHQSAAPAIEQQIRSGNLRISDIFDGLAVYSIDSANFQDIDPHLTSFANINTPNDLDSYIRPTCFDG